MSLQTFHELHVISDLHLGGKPGFQSFCQGEILANLIRHLAQQPSNRHVGLVLNGDIVDFLAEAPAGYLDPQGAIHKLERIFYQDTAFSSVWLALQEFIAQPDRQLVLVLGNHDVELALPHVSEWLLERLSNNDSAASAPWQTNLSADSLPGSGAIEESHLLLGIQGRVNWNFWNWGRGDFDVNKGDFRPENSYFWNINLAISIR